MTKLRYNSGKILYSDGKTGDATWQAINCIVRSPRGRAIYDGYDLVDDRHKEIAKIDFLKLNPPVLKYTAQSYQRLAQEVERISKRDDLTIIVS